MALYKYFNYSLLSLLSRVVRSLDDMAEAERPLSSQFIAVTGTSAIVKYAAGRLDLLQRKKKLPPLRTERLQLSVPSLGRRV